MKSRTIALGCDHAGFSLKEAVVKGLTLAGYIVMDFGTHGSESVDYPDFAHPTAHTVEQGQAKLGILMCGSGNGVAMSANKHKGVRAALCWSKEIAALARQHNNANVICVPVRFLEEAEAMEMIMTFVKTEFEGGRHARRVGKISC